MGRSYYSAEIPDYLKTDNSSIFGDICNAHNHDINDQTKNAWKAQIVILKEALEFFNSGKVYFEFAIPRMGKRVDNIIIINNLVIVIEFKIGDNEYQKHAIDQVLDYCLDLQNFHEGSHNLILVPLLVATKANEIENKFEFISKNIYKPIKSTQSNLKVVLNNVINESNINNKIDIYYWENSIYKPTPTIIEASQALYSGHSVEEISRSDSGAINLSITSNCINIIIEKSKLNQTKSICFITGVPGAGKTLAGLNIANERRKINEDEHAVFLSGNGPLVYVLREALARNDVENSKSINQNITKAQAKIKANAFIQNIHHFRDDNFETIKAPVEKVVVFDEAQRAWTKEKATTFMKIKGKEFNKSEPDFLIEVMNRHNDNCTIICLIGGGQEINTGEAGLSEWINALKNNVNYKDWKIYYSNKIISDEDYLKNSELIEWLELNGIKTPDLHLSTSLRAFRSEMISKFITDILNIEKNSIQNLVSEIKNTYPIKITRNLETAKIWLKTMAKGTERIGIVGCSSGRRLKPLGIDVKNEISVEEWFLNNKDDVRSSYYLEQIATEYDIQGLEIDYTCVAWDIDFYFKDNKWNYQKFEGTKWKNMKSDFDKSYLKNSYRVLLTRARQGMIIFVPEGDDNDHTRPKVLYDGTFNYLKSIGIDVI